jgi:hypothetical protein
MSEWTFGYYINNAAVRMGELTRRSATFAAILQEHDIHQMGWQIVATLDPKMLWDRTYSALHLSVANVDRIFAEATSRI